MKLPKTTHSDRNKIETVNSFIASQLSYYEGCPVTLTNQRIERDVFGAFGIKIHLVDHKKINKKQEDDVCFIAYNIYVSNKKREMLLEFLGNETYDTVFLKFKKEQLEPRFEYERY
tara:strand:- start:1330 stop:1677 length:348 start_codon:yes stop_codon:yes gene_type:complete